jgi:hypothetical protein
MGTQILTDHDALPAFGLHQDAWHAGAPEGFGPRGSSGPPKPPTQKVVYMNVACGMPFLRQGAPANAFRQLRKAVIEAAGFDFLATCADMMRGRDLRSEKVGVAYRSRHKCGDAFDYDQTQRALAVVVERHGLQTFFRTWLRCARQDGSQGIKVRLNDVRGYALDGYYVDFTALADRFGWKRIPAWSGWGLKGSGYNKMEFWHYQLTEGLTWAEAMAYLYGAGKNPTVKDVRQPPAYRTLGLNDRGSAVRNMQEKLSKLKRKSGDGTYLPRVETDGVFGPVTQAAVKALQVDYGLDPDGLVGPLTRNLIETLL